MVSLAPMVGNMIQYLEDYAFHNSPSIFSCDLIIRLFSILRKSSGVAAYFRCFVGFLSNCVLQFVEQKKYVIPPCVLVAAAFFSSTFIAQTGSLAIWLSTSLFHGLNLFRMSEFPTTVTELVAIAPAAKNGRKLYTLGPKNGTSAPAAIGIRATL